MSAPNPNSNLGAPVVTRTISWRDLAERTWGADFRAPDHGVYQFSSGRKFDSTDLDSTGIYNGGAA
jgi:hypothetical protein